MYHKGNVVNAAQIAQKNLVCCTADTPIYSAAKQMKNSRTSSILIKEDDQIIGIWTEADSTKVVFDDGENFNKAIKHYMSSPVIQIKDHTPLQEVIMAFHRHRVRHLLIVDVNNQPMGITSQTDVIKNQGVEKYLQLRKIKDNFNPKIPIVCGRKSINAVAKKMAEYRSSSAIIHDESSDEYGIITERDLLKLIANQQTTKASWHFAAYPLLTIEVNDTLHQAYMMIKQHNVRHLVVCEQEKIVGILSLQHILSDLEIAYIQKLELVLDQRDEALKESKRHLFFAEKIIEESLDSIMVTDKDECILSINPAFTKLTGYSEAEALGNKSNLLSSGLHNDEFYQNMWTAINEQGTWQGEITNKKKNGELYPEWLTIVRLGDDSSEEYYAAIFSDISERKKTESQIHALAFFDDLTGLPNRRLFNDRFEVALSLGHRNNLLTAILFLDLDRFKQINDNLGHKVGDELLKVTAERLTGCLKEGDSVSRFGGDEFIVLLTEMANVTDIVGVVDRILQVLSEPYVFDGRELHVTSSIGVAIAPEDGDNTDTLLKHADIAMYQAKDNGRNSFQLYSPEMNVISMERLIMQNCLQTALKKNEFTLHYQLKIDHENKKVVGIEALLRWQHQDLGNVSPAQFIPLAEELGLIVDIDCWVLEQACKQRKQWQLMGFDCGAISVNISPLHFNHDLVYSVEKVLEETQLTAQLLELEVTEGCFIKNIESARVILQQITALGVSSSIDDFGTGYSSLSYLSQLSFDILKIDGSFVAKVPQDPQQCQIVSAIIAMAKALNVSLVAEGVETLEQVNFLADKGCHIYQGYYFSKPESADITELKMTEYFLRQNTHESKVVNKKVSSNRV